MSGCWLIEQRADEVWAWSLEESLFLRLGRCGMGRVFDLRAQKLLGEFRWKTPLVANDFSQMQPQMWVELLDAQLADFASDLVLARNFHLTPPDERAWQLLVFERGSRESFCDCVRFVFTQNEVLQSFANHQGARTPDTYGIQFRLEGERNIRWDCNFGWFSSGGGHFPELQQKLYHILGFFGPERNPELVSQRRTSSDFRPALWEIQAPVKFEVAFDPEEFSSHDHLEHFLQMRQLFETFLSPHESANLLQQLSSR